MGTRSPCNRLLASSGEWEQPVNLGRAGQPRWGLSLPTCRMDMGMDEVACPVFMARALSWTEGAEGSWREGGGEGTCRWNKVGGSADRSQWAAAPPFWWGGCRKARAQEGRRVMRSNGRSHRTALGSPRHSHERKGLEVQAQSFSFWLKSQLSLLPAVWSRGNHSTSL